MSNEQSEPVDLTTSDCTICRHEKAAEIDEGLLGGTTVRTVAETYGLSRSSVGRHRLNHLSAQAVTDPPSDIERKPLRIVDVHAQLTDLADRLEKVVEVATRTRKAPAAVAAARELRQTLVAIAEIQARPELQRAASLERLQKEIDEAGADTYVRLLDFVLSQFGEGFISHEHGATEQARLVADLMANCLRNLGRDGIGTKFGDVDTSKARAYVERQALERAHRMESEVQRRVNAELRRREAQSRPALEAREVPAIEGGASSWRP